MRVDVHAHLYPAAYRAVMERLGGDTTRYPLGSDASGELEARFEMMDGAGVNLQVLSVSSQQPYFDNQAKAIEGAKAANDLYAEFVTRYPGRFRAFAALPLPHVDAALGELERALDQLKMVGMTIGTSIKERSAADPAFDPLWAELNRRAAVVFVHPAGLGLCSPLVRDYGLTWPVGAPFEDTMFAMHLIERQIPIRYPRVKIIVPHFGGLMPLVMPRIDQHSMLFMKDEAEPPSATALRLWYDTVGHGSLEALRCAYAAFGADRLVYGSDYPFQVKEHFLKSVTYVQEAGFPAGDVKKILDSNGTRLLGLESAK